MRLKKISYVIVLILALAIGINKTYAGTEKCNYIAYNGEFKAQLTMRWGYKEGWFFGANFRTTSDYADIDILRTPNKALESDDDHVSNWYDNNGSDDCTKNGQYCFNNIYASEYDANNDPNPTCPEYLVFQHCRQYFVWATNDKDVAEMAVNVIQKEGCTGIYATYKDEKGNKYTPEQLFADYTYDADLNFDSDGNIECDEFFGDISDEDSLAYMIHLVMQYVRVCVPILIILLGTIDLAKAVLASKEDTIKKAQLDLVKRVIMGVAIFFVPLLVDVIMELADIVWQGGYSYCDFNF